MMTTASPASIAYEYVTKQSQKLTEKAIFDLHLAKFAEKDVISERNGKTMRYYIEPEGDKDDVRDLNEGSITTDLTDTDVETSYVDVTLQGRYWKTSLTDQYMSTGFINKLKMSQSVAAQSLALKADNLIASSIITAVLNTDTATTKNELFSALATGDSSADFATMKAGTAATYVITEADYLMARTAARRNGYTLKGVVMPDEVFMDFSQNSGVRGALNYSTEKVLNGQLVKYWGEDILVTNRGWRETTYGTYSKTGNVYSTFFIGSGAFVTPTWSVKNAGKDMISPKWLIVDKPDHYDPAGEKIDLTAKMYWNTGILKENALVVLRSRSSKF